MQINGLSKTTLLDYPKHLAATIFLGGCNMRCPFCHNASLVKKAPSVPVIPEYEVLDFLRKRSKMLEGVCITGGEPTLYPELPDFIRTIKDIGYKVKLDTNGTNPTMIKALCKEHLIDYIAMDIKNSKENYPLSAGIVHSLAQIEESVSYLLSSPVDCEFRTTIVHEHHKEQDMLAIGQWIKGARSYHLQSYRDSEDILVPGLTPPSKETLMHYKNILAPFIESVTIRGVD